MPFDALVTAAMADELHAALASGRVQRIIQPSDLSVALSVHTPGHTRWLLLSADPREARAALVEGKLAKAFATPSPFVMLLRKHVEDVRMGSVAAEPYERVLRIGIGAGDADIRLMVEIMGKHSNVVLVERDVVLGALKLVGPKQSRVRPILPGRPYTLPPPQGRDTALFGEGPRLDPHRSPQDFASTLAHARGSPLRSALLGLLPGASPFLVDQICQRAGVDGGTTLREEDVPAVEGAAGELFALYATRAWHPCTFRNAKGAPDFTPYLPFGMADVEFAGSMSEAISRVVGERENRDVLHSSRAALLRDVERALHSARRRLASLESGLAATDGAEEAMTAGQMILAYQYAIEPHAAELAIPEMELRIPLDPSLSAQANAERSFRRYRKLRDARERLPAMVEGAEAEVARLEDLETFVRLAGSEAELRELRRELEGEGAPAAKAKGKPQAKRGPARYTLDGHTAIAGRTARENEEVTFRMASRDDLWLHARERTGAHVVLPGGGSVPEDVVRAAAALAGYLSEGRADGAVDVDVTEVRNVRKIPGGPPGRVTYRHFRTIRVPPRLEPWQPAGKG